MKTRKKQLQLAQKYAIDASQLQYKSEYIAALDSLQKAAAIYLQCKEWAAYVISKVDVLGLHIKLTHTQKALECLDKTLEIAESTLPPKHEVFRDIFNGYGNYYCYLDDYQTGLIYYQKAWEVSEHCQNRDFDDIRIYANMGTCWGYAGQYEKQLENLQTTLQLIEIYLSPAEQASLNVQKAIAQLYNNIAWVYGELGDFQQNLAYQNKALALRKAVLPESHPDIAASYSNIGGCYTLTNDFEKEVLYFQKALRMYREVFGESHYDVGRMYNNLGGSYQSVEDYDKQLYYYQKALDNHLHLFGESHPFVARCYINIGYNYILKEDYPTALQNLLKAKEIKAKLLGKEHFEMGNLYDKLGKCYDGLQAYEKSLQCYQMAIAIKEKTVGQKHPVLAMTYRFWGMHYFEQQHFTKSLNCLQKAIDNLRIGNKNKGENGVLFQRHRFSKLLLKTIIWQGKAYYLRYIAEEVYLNDLKKAIQTFKTAIQLLDYIRNNFQIEYSKLVLSKNATEICEYALRAALKLWKETNQKEYLEECFYFSEKNRAMVLLEALKDTQAKLTANIPSELLEQEKNIRIALTFVERKLQQLQLKSQPNLTAIAQLQEQQFKHHRAYEELLKKYETAYPSYFQLKYNSKTSSIAAIQKYLSDNNLLIEYFVGEKKIFIFYLQKEDFGLKTIAKPTDFKNLIDELQHAVAWADEELLVEAATNLYRLLLFPIEHQIQSCQQLIFIRDENLHLLPFDLLIPPSKLEKIDFNTLPYLICSHEITYHYSATTWLYCLQKQEEHSTQSDNFLGIAPVSFHETSEIELAIGTRRGSSQILRSNIEGDVALQNLPNTAIEVKNVYNLFHDKKLDAKAFLYGAASKQTLIEESASYKYLLISTHGFAHPNRSNLSGIHLSSHTSEEQTEGESILTISEAYNLDLSADLVVLSSCSSGVGALQQGEGIMAINRGFLYAGANNIIFTQFDIPDESSSKLVKHLFEEILKGKSYAAALRIAKLALLREEDNSPQDWAGFSLIGQ